MTDEAQKKLLYAPQTLDYSYTICGCIRLSATSLLSILSVFALVSMTLASTALGIASSNTGSASSIDQRVFSPPPPQQVFSPPAAQDAATRVRIAMSFASGPSAGFFGWPAVVADMKEIANIELVSQFPDPTLTGETNGKTYHPFSTMQMVFDDQADAAFADSNWWVTAYAADLPGIDAQSTAVPRSVALWVGAFPFGLTRGRFNDWLLHEGNALVDQQAGQLNPAVPLKNFYGFSSGPQPAGYVASAGDPDNTYRANPIAWYQGKTIRTGGLSAEIFKEWGAVAGAATPDTFFDVDTGLKNYDAVGNVRGTFDGGEFIGPFPDTLFGVISKNLTKYYVKTAGFETNPGINIVLKKNVWDTLAAQQKNAFQAVLDKHSLLTVKNFAYLNSLRYEQQYVPKGPEYIVDLNEIDVAYNGTTKSVMQHAKDVWDAKDAAFKADTDDPFYATIKASLDSFQALTTETWSVQPDVQ